MTVPWYRRTRRWGQTNLTEIDPERIDLDAWREHWRRTRVQGLIVNAGGIVAYYPSSFDLPYRAAFLGNRDLFGEIVAAAREEGLTVLARMDSNRADARFHNAHPDWFATDPDGRPYRSGDRFIACINGPYYRDFLPEVLREIAERYRPDGFTDNSWSGLGRRSICHCAHCRERFGGDTGLDLPQAVNWDDPAYRRWIPWSYARRTELWCENDRIVRGAGGPDCLWLGMVHGDPFTSHLSFCDLTAVGDGAPILMTDQQSRDATTGFEQNRLTGHLLHGIAGDEAVIPESMALYVRGEQAFRRAAAPPEEARTWMISGFAGGISPWWHHVGAVQEDRRQFATAEPLMQWHEAHEEFLYDRTPVADVGLVWSYENIDFYGRDDARARTLLPWRGFTRALTKARIPFLPVHADRIDHDAARFRALVLPDLAAMTDAQVDAVRRFAEAGGSIVATGRTGALSAEGDPRGDSALGDLLGIRAAGPPLGVDGQPSSSWEVHTGHNYLRLPSDVDGRHPVLDGFVGTDLIGFGGTLQRVEAADDARVAATYVPAFPIYPPEFSWMREEKTDIPAVVTCAHPAGGRLVYLAGDIDRCYARRALPDHGRLLANAVRWVTGGVLPLTVEGPGYIDVCLYRQDKRFILHLVNLTGCNEWPGYVEEHVPVGPLHIRIDVPAGDWQVRQVNAGTTANIAADDGVLRLTVAQVEAHEMVVFSPA